MTANTDSRPTIEERLAQLTEESAALDLAHKKAQREVEACISRMQVLRRCISSIQTATTTLAGLASPAPEQAWLGHLTAWRKTLCDELLALPRIRDAHALGVQQNLALSIRAIDDGPGVANGTGYSLTTLRLGHLMRKAGYEPEGADPERNYSRLMPWFGTIQEVEQRIQRLAEQRADAEARLEEALLDDAAREKLAAGREARRAELNAAPRRKTRGDGSQYDRYPDGRVVEIHA